MLNKDNFDYSKKTENYKSLKIEKHIQDIVDYAEPKWMSMNLLFICIWFDIRD